MTGVTAKQESDQAPEQALESSAEDRLVALSENQLVKKALRKKDPKKTSAKKTTSKDKSNGITPMMAQFLGIKEEHPDCLLFYRMGDFYELFFEDAQRAAEALDITLTHRGKHLGKDIPMCGVPVHAAESYLAKLIRKGFKVAVAEQTENPAEAKKRGGKALVRREIARVVTQGTLIEDTLLEARRHNYLAAVCQIQGQMGLAWIDISTGNFQVQALENTRTALGTALSRLDPGEILTSERLLGQDEWAEVFGQWKNVISPLPGSRFDSENAQTRLQSLYGVASLQSLGDFSRCEVAAAGALIDYVEMTQKGKLPRIADLRRFAVGDVLEVDPATVRNLEIFQCLDGGHEGSLLSAIDRTVTGAGARLLCAHLAAPLTRVEEINQRLDMVAFFLDQASLRARLREELARCPDMERALSRLTLGRCGPRDLAAIKNGLVSARAIGEMLEKAGAKDRKGLAAALAQMAPQAELIETLSRALNADLPHLIRDGGFIAPGYCAELDEFKTLRDESRRLVAALQSRYVNETGISTLKIRHNNVLGYFVEVTASHAAKVPIAPDGPFLHRQSMSNAVRFTTTELSTLQSKITGAADRALGLEIEIFGRLIAQIAERANDIALIAQALAAFDVACANGQIAGERDFCQPHVDDSFDFEIKAGRHPVVEFALMRDNAPKFTPNDCDLGQGERLWLLTGPNMAGKSTFLRQNALMVLMAQSGMYVPAASARIGVVDRLFSRVGAADDLSRGRSTFMVEMVETAAILNQSGPRSLVILDEIGRGTATFDGLSIAWACIEYLHEINVCRAFFATHYHELTSLSAKLDALCLHTMLVKEWKGDVIFLHEVRSGTAQGSYGIHVADLAGLPRVAIERAKQILGILETGEQASALNALADDLPLFATMADDLKNRDQGDEVVQSQVEATLSALCLDEMTPREALEELYRLKAMTPR